MLVLAVTIKSYIPKVILKKHSSLKYQRIVMFKRLAIRYWIVLKRPKILQLTKLNDVQGASN